jgi:hypothetical protein
MAQDVGFLLVSEAYQCSIQIPYLVEISARRTCQHSTEDRVGEKPQPEPEHAKEADGG